MRYEAEEGVFVNTERAKQSWGEDTYHDGRNLISRATGDQWLHETLYLSARGNYYIVSTSQWQGSRDVAHFVSAEEAAAWLLRNRHPLPDDLAAYDARMCE